MPHNNDMKRSGNDNNNRNRQGREGRGRENKRNSRNNANKNNNNNNDKKKERKVLKDYIFHLKTSKQADDCEIISKYLIDHIEKTHFNGDDIENALNQLREIDFKMSMTIKEEVNVDEDENINDREE